MNQHPGQTAWHLTGGYRWEESRWLRQAELWVEEERQCFEPPIQPSYVQGFIPGKWVTQSRWRRARISDLSPMGFAKQGNTRG